MVSAVADALAAAFGAGRVQTGVGLASLTTFRVGGPADMLLETRSSDELVAALRIAARTGTRVTILGGGSNVLVADSGIRGLVIRPRGGVVTPVAALTAAAATRVRAAAAVTINGFVRWTINHGFAALEAWAGTPGTVGGAVFGNAHFGGRNIGELVASVRLASREGDVREAEADAMAFAYDRSRL